MAPKTIAPNHHWSFFRAGGVDQVRLDTGADILNLPTLDQKLWVALSCPVKGLEFDERTLAFLDTDNDGRVRAPEILEAVRWVGARLKDADSLTKAEDGMPIAAIAATPEGKQIAAAAKRILASLGKENAAVITVADTMATTEFFAKSKHNGDGVVPPDAIDDPATQKVAQQVLDCIGGEDDRSGKKGISQATVDAFFAAAEAYSEWMKQSEGPSAKTMLPLGKDTAAAHTALCAVRKKVDDWFARCRLAAFDPRAQAALNREESAYIDVAAQDMSIDAHEVQHFPLARVEPGKPLALTVGINPAWHDAMTAFHTAVVVPALGKDRKELSEADWSELCRRFAPFESWLAAKAGAAVEKLGIERVREILGGGFAAKLAEAIAEDVAVKPEIDAIESVEKLTRYYRDLHVLLCNFVSFTDFYSRRRKAVFQVGTLYLDGRSCDLCFRVDDGAKHGVLAAMAKSYLAYCDLSRPSSGEKMTVAAAFTAGDSDHLLVGRNGLFYDRKGRDWDATITKIIDQPISIGQAFFAPYKRFLRWIEEQVAKRAAAADAASGEKLTGAATAAGEAAATGKAPAQKPKIDIGIVAALGVAVGGIGTAFGLLMNSFFGLGVWMPLGVVAIILLISGPSMVIAWLKLRQRNLGPILDANGWAVNGRVKINIPFGGALTAMPKLPEGSERSLVDPYAEKRSPWPRIIVVLLVLAGLTWGAYKLRLLDTPLKWVEEKTGWKLVAPPETDKTTTTTTTTTPATTPTTTTTEPK